MAVKKTAKSRDGKSSKASRGASAGKNKKRAGSKVTAAATTARKRTSASKAKTKAKDKTTAKSKTTKKATTKAKKVRKRPGMYTDTTRPNHLAQEVVDNSVDEALAGHAQLIEVDLYKDGSLEVRDDGRGMPVDMHPELKLPGVEVIMTTLHAGGKFSNDNYNFSGGLHGVGVSVVNALSSRLEVRIKRQGYEFLMGFKGGEIASKLQPLNKVGQRNTGTAIRFWPDKSYFDSAKFSLARLKHLLRAKAVLCPGLVVRLYDEESNESEEWCFEDGIADYLANAVNSTSRLPQTPYSGGMEGSTEAVNWALVWLPDGGEPVQESYVNLVPTAQGGTHVNGFRSGLTDALREFCDFRNLLPSRMRKFCCRCGQRPVCPVAEPAP